MTNGPLYALQNGESGGNGVYRYGAGGGFPSSTFGSSNYWVDVVFTSGPAPTLTSIAVTPANPTIQIGVTQQFTATGTYSDNSTQNLTSQVTWASATPAVASVNATGLATGLSAGASTISATLSGETGSTVLTVQAAPLAITTASLLNGTQGRRLYGDLDGQWRHDTLYLDHYQRCMPVGLTLDGTTGVISGTPTAAGTSNFTVRVTDSSTPTAATASKSLSLTVTASASTLTTIAAHHRRRR